MEIAAGGKKGGGGGGRSEVDKEQHLTVFFFFDHFFGHLKLYLFLLSWLSLFDLSKQKLTGHRNVDLKAFENTDILSYNETSCKVIL